MGQSSGRGKGFESKLGKTAFINYQSPNSINGMFNPFINNIIWRMVTGDRSSTKDPKIIRFTQLLDRQFKNLEPYNVLSVLQLRFPSLVWLCDKLGLEVRGGVVL